MAWQIYAAWAAAFLVKKFLIPKPREEEVKRQRLRERDIPRAEEGAPIPLFWGRNRIRAGNVVWVGNARSVDDRYNGRPINPSYAASMHIVLGIPGQGLGSRANDGAKLYKLYIGDVIVWSGTLSSGGRVKIERLDALGGRGAGGGVIGTLEYLGGKSDQTIDYTTEFTAAGHSVDLLPFYRRQCALILSNRDSGFPTTHGWLIGESPQLPPISAEVGAETVSDIGAHPSTFGSVGGDANPVAVLIDLLSTKWGRVGMEEARIDLENFYAVGQVLRDERHGISLVLEDPDEARTVIQNIADQIGAALYVDPTDNKIKIKLIRDDYVASTLPLFDESNILEFQQFSTQSWQETFNVVRVNYTDRAQHYTTRTQTAQDLANIAMQGGRKRDVNRVYPGISNAQLAQRIAARELFFNSVPLSRCRLKLNRLGYKLRPGDVFRVSWERYGLVDVVFRVQRFDLGSSEDEAIVIDAIQDRFGLRDAVFDPVVEVDPAPLVPLPLRTRVAEEAPRWVLRSAELRGQIPSRDSQRLWYLAHKEQEPSPGFRVRLERAGDDETDQFAQPYTGTFLVETAYPRTLDPYDTSTGLRIKNASGTFLLQTATPTEIRTSGKNLIYVDGEFMAFESFTDLGGGVIRLNNVWRGLLDTPAVDHAVDAPGYGLSNGFEFGERRHVGRTGVLVGDVIETKHQPRLGRESLDQELLDPDVTTVRGRTNLPYPAADLTINGAKTVTYDEEAATFAWKDRWRLSETIKRGDDADETEATTGAEANLYALFAQRRPLHLQQPNVDPVSSAFAQITSLVQSLSDVGHGPTDLSLRTARLDQPLLESWKHPTLRVDLLHWRNLLTNPRFASGTTGWTAATGTMVVGTTGPGAVGNYLAGDVGADLDVSQDVVLGDAWDARHMRAQLTFYVKMVADDEDVIDDDTITVSLIAKDASDTVLATQTFGPNVPVQDRWVKQSLAIAQLPVNTYKLTVRVEMEGLDDVPAPNTGIAELTLRVGQAAAFNALTNPSFESSGSPDFWSGVSGTWTIDTTPANGVEGANHLRSTSTTVAELSQTFVLTAGYESGARAVLTGWRKVTAPATAEIVLEVLDGGSNVIASATTEAGIPPTWMRDQLTCEIPFGAASVRVRLIATPAGGIGNGHFDDFDLRIHKHLDPAVGYDARFDTPPVQAWPENQVDWHLRYGTSPPCPDYGFYTGRAIDDGFGAADVLALGPPLESATDVTSEIYGLFGEGVTSTPAFFFPTGGDGLQAAFPDDLYGNFGKDDPFTIVAFYRTQHEGNLTAGQTFGICKRRGTSGWAIGGASDQMRVEITDRSATTVGITRAAAVAGRGTYDGALHMVAVTYDPSTDTLKIHDERGFSSASTTSLGDFTCDELVRFVVGGPGLAGATTDMAHQVIGPWIWRSVLSDADIQKLFAYGTDPSTRLTTYTRDQGIYVPIPDGADGVRLGRYAYDQVALAQVSGQTGIALWRPSTNLVKVQDFTDAAWSPQIGISGSIFRNFPGILDVEGASRVAQWSGTNTDNDAFRLTVTLSSATTVRVIWFAKGTGTHRLLLRNTSGVTKGTHDFVGSAVWQRFEHTFTTWDGTTAQGRLEFFASSTGSGGTVQLSTPVFVSQENYYPPFIPASGDGVNGGGGPDAALLTFDVRAADSYAGQLNHEGQLAVWGAATHQPAGELVLVDLRNDSNSNDRRQLRLNASNQPAFDHYDGAGSAATTLVSAITWTSPFAISGLWSRVRMLDNATGSDDHSGIDVNGTKTFTRTAPWTASAVPTTDLRFGGAASSGFGGVLSRVALVAREVVRGDL